MKEKKSGQLRIAMLGHKRIPSREGGIEIVVEELSTRMVELGHAVTCYNRKGHHVSGVEFDGEERSEYKGVRLKTVPTIERKGLAAVTSSFFASLFAAVGPYDVVHIHAEGPAFFCWLPKLFGKRVVVTIHGLDWMREKWKGKDMDAPAIIRLLYNKDICKCSSCGGKIIPLPTEQHFIKPKPHMLC